MESARLTDGGGRRVGLDDLENEGENGDNRDESSTRVGHLHDGQRL